MAYFVRKEALRLSSGVRSCHTCHTRRHETKLVIQQNRHLKHNAKLIWQFAVLGV